MSNSSTSSSDSPLKKTGESYATHKESALRTTAAGERRRIAKCQTQCDRKNVDARIHPWKIFVAGIIQGSIKENSVCDQSYRIEIRRVIREHYPNSHVYDPVEIHPNSISYDEECSRNVFFEEATHAAESDVLVAFLPSASMGTAIEIWNAWHGDAIVVCITELKENWVVKCLSDKVIPNIVAFEQWINEGGLDEMLKKKK